MTINAATINKELQAIADKTEPGMPYQLCYHVILRKMCLTVLEKYKDIGERTISIEEIGTNGLLVDSFYIEFYRGKHLFLIHKKNTYGEFLFSHWSFGKVIAYIYSQFLENAILIGGYSEGIVYADKRVEEDGDYKRLAFLPYDTLELEFRGECCSKETKEFIRRKAEEIIKRRGERYEITTSGQWVILGERRAYD